jgi:predicted ATP-dependent endonuclease of OLD family
MKISKLNIKEFRHLKDLEFDFTYPKDYKDKSKAGKPLDKICFIGQSATGKTGLLELINSYIERALYQEIIGDNSLLNKDETLFINASVDLYFGDNLYQHTGDVINFNHQTYKEHWTGGKVTPLIPNEIKRNLIFLRADLISKKNIALFAKNPTDIIEGLNSSSEKFKDVFKSYKDFHFLFDDDVEINSWAFLLKDVLDYRKKFTQKMSEFINAGLIANQKKLNTEFNKWQKENPNIIKDFANAFNPMLKRLNLEVDVVNTEYPIPLVDKTNDTIIPIQQASTGTKGLLLSFLPLFKLDTKDGIVLIDEPERSLYPDMQMDLMEHYSNLAGDAQIIVATHSPFIAASFEPEERFILYFDDTGKVNVKKGASPIGDDPNDLLKNDFNINYYNKYGEEAYKKYITLKEKVSQEKNTSKKKELMLEMVKLGNTYNF